MFVPWSFSGIHIAELCFEKYFRLYFATVSFLACLTPATLLKKRFRHRCFPVNFAKFLRTPFFREHFQVVAPGVSFQCGFIMAWPMFWSGIKIFNCYNKNHFLFNNKFYKQIDSVDMGSPLGPALANIFMWNFQNKWLKDCPHSLRPVLFRRYVDVLLFFSLSIEQKV